MTTLPLIKAMLKRNFILAGVLIVSALGRSGAQAPGGVSSGLQVWLKADAGTSTTTNNDFLSSWSDQSGNGFNATQSVSGNRPQFVADAINGYPAVKTSSSRFFNIDFSSINDQNFTIFTVTRRQAGGSFQNILGVQNSTAYVGLCLSYAGTGLIRFFQYGNIVSLACPSYNASTEIPTILSCHFDQGVGKKVWHIRDGVQTFRNGVNKTHYSMSGGGRIGKGNDNYGFTGLISEVIVYNRVLSDAEKKQVHTYLCVKYGLSIPAGENLYYTESAYPNDVFGIGKNVATQGLNHTVSNSVGLDDILEIRNPSSLDDGDYLLCGNDNAANSFAVYSGTNCGILQMLSRKWKFKRVNDPGTVSLRFDLGAVGTFTASDLRVLVDQDGDGFDDETPLTGSYSAPYFTVDNVQIPDGATIALAQVKDTWYAVVSGNSNGAIWSDTPAGSPQSISGFCAGVSYVINTGVTVNNNFATGSCKNFQVSAGGIWNAGSATLNISGNLVVNGTFNAQTSSLVFNGSTQQNIQGSNVTNVYNMTLNNSAGLVISPTGSGVRARNQVNVTSGTLTTNNKLSLTSDATTTGMITSLATGSVSGGVTIQRYRNGTAAGWVNLSSPIQGKTIQDWNDDILTTGFLGSDYPPPYSFNNVQTYNEAAAGGINAGYVGATNITNPLQTGRGYFVYLNAGVMMLDIDGTINSGDQNLPVTFTNTGNAAADGWNLVGNPYPCAIDWNAASWTKTNINNAVYVWNASIGQYASYVNGLATNGGSRYIPSSQSFFVVANAASPSLVVREDCKTTNQGNFKSAEVHQETLTLHIQNELYSDETTISFHPLATQNFESDLDAFKLRSPMSEVPYFSTISAEGYDLSVNVIENLNEETILPLRMEVGVSGAYELSYTGLNSFANGACVVLEDLLTGDVYPLNQYSSISLRLEAGNSDPRYQIRIGGSRISNVSSSGCPGMENGSALVEIADGSSCDVTWIDDSGEIISAMKAMTGSAELNNLSPGAYTVIIENNGSCGTTYTDIIIREDDPVVAYSAVIPASCADTQDGGIELDIEGGSAPYTVSWNTGAVSDYLENVPGGTYTAFITDSKGCKSTVHVELPVSGKVRSSFETIAETYELMNGAVMVDFYNTSQHADNYLWNFGDGTLTSADANTSHLFNRKGSYEISLRAADDNCQSVYTKIIRITQPGSNGDDFASSVMGNLTNDGVSLRFFFDEPRNIVVRAYNVLGQQLIEPIRGSFGNQTLVFSDRQYAANALVEVTDENTGERAIIRLGN